MPLNFNNFDVASIQATIYTPGLTFSHPKVLSYILSKWGDVFNGQPISLPAPEDLPPQVPRIIIESADKHYKIEAAPARMNIFLLRVDPEEDLAVRKFYSLVPEVLNGYRKETVAQVGRLAGVLTQTAFVDNPAALIVSKFCRNELIDTLFKDPESFELHCHKRYKLSGLYNVNSWMRLKTGFIRLKEKNQKVLVVEQDINTFHEELNTANFIESEIEDFFKHLPDEIDSIIKYYFPSEE